MATQKFLQQLPISPLLPLFCQSTPGDDEDFDPPLSPFFDELLYVSPAVPAVVWLIETSTNPDVISAAADMAVDLQWPLHANLDVVLDQLWNEFFACFGKYTLIDNNSGGLEFHV
jgi:hypothetical protein